MVLIETIKRIVSVSIEIVCPDEFVNFFNLKLCATTMTVKIGNCLRHGEKLKKD